MPAANTSIRLRLVVDTNGWISSFISPQSPLATRLRQLRTHPEVELLFSTELRQEILNVLQRPKFARYFLAAQRGLAEELIASFALVAVQTNVSICRDPKDNFLLALCQDGGADFLITGDQDLLVLEQFGRTRIINWATAEVEPALQPTK